MAMERVPKGIRVNPIKMKMRENNKFKKAPFFFNWRLE